MCWGAAVEDLRAPYGPWIQTLSQAVERAPAEPRPAGPPIPRDDPVVDAKDDVGEIEVVDLAPQALRDWGIRAVIAPSFKFTNKGSVVGSVFKGEGGDAGHGYRSR